MGRKEKKKEKYILRKKKMQKIEMKRGSEL